MGQNFHDTPLLGRNAFKNSGAEQNGMGCDGMGWDVMGV